MKNIKHNLIIILIITLVVVGLVVVGGLLWKNKSDNGEPTPELRTWTDRGIDEENQRRLEGRISEIIERIGNDRDITDLNLWIDLGSFRFILGDLAGARDAFVVATELNELNYLSWGNLGDVLAEMNDLAGAEKAYRKAIELVDNEMYYEKYANFLQTYFPDRKTDYENILLTAVRAVGQEPQFLARLAVFYEAEGRLEEAKSHLEVLHGLAPDEQGVLKDLERVNRLIEEKN